MNFDSLLNPPLPVALDEFYRTLLSVSGVMFGIAFAAMLYILQSGFSSFKYSRRMFLELYLHFGRQLLYTLSYLTAAPFVILFFTDNVKIISWLYFLYIIYFLNATLDYAKEEGYIITLHSSKFVPKHYGRVRRYFRYIQNRGILRNTIFLLPIIAFIIYPYAISIHQTSSLYLAKTSIFYSCLVPLFYTLYKITKFVPEFFVYTNMELSSNCDDPNREYSEEEKQKHQIEILALKEHLKNHGISELTPLSPIRFIDGELWVQFLENRNGGEAWFNVNVHITNATPGQIRANILEYCHRFSKLLYLSKVEINTFVMSFHISVDTKTSRNMFFRFTRSELEKVYMLGRDVPEDMAGLKNVLFDELFRL